MQPRLASAMIAILCATAYPARATPADPLIAQAGVAVVDTAAGKIQGFIRNGIFTYRGIPYATAARFMPPEKVAPWQGVRLAVSYGPISPMSNPSSTSGDEMFNPHRYWPENENCQYLNLWTPALHDGKKRPVMVWLHGGGFSAGSSIEQDAYDGEQLSRKGDVVVISLNHRLNAIGYLDLSAYGERYRYSGNVGMMDLVAALGWVRDNIAQFGGDPGNVTLFGQSGGGGKILTLMAAPAAKGLFHKAIVESGTFPDMGMNELTQDVSHRVAAHTLEELSIPPAEVDRLQTVPYDQLIAAANKALATTARELEHRDFFGATMFRFAPVLDGDYIPQDPVGATFAEGGRDIPLLIGSTLAEFNTIIRNPADKLLADSKNRWTPEQTRVRLQEKYGDKADEVAKAFAQAYPDHKLADAFFVDTVVRPGTIATARAKADQGGAPVYAYLFAWESPILDGIAMAYHCSEIPFVFDNVASTQTAHGGGKAAQALADEVSQAWVSFARTGNPKARGLPPWPAYTREGGATMIIDASPAVRRNHDLTLLAALTGKPL